MSESLQFGLYNGFTDPEGSSGSPTADKVASLKLGPVDRAQHFSEPFTLNFNLETAVALPSWSCREGYSTLLGQWATRRKA